MRFLTALLALWLSLLAPPGAAAPAPAAGGPSFLPLLPPAEPHASWDLSLHWGTFGVFDTEQIFEAGFESRGPSWRHGLRPILGASVLDDGGNYVYAGLRGEWHLTRRLGIAPSFAPGIYSPGGIDLGGPLEFRSGIDLTWELDDTFTLGVGLYHLSNGGLYSRNGGSESVLFSLTYSL